MLEFFLWFWLLDRRFLCDLRPALKYFSFLFLLPIAFHSLMISFNIYCLFPFTKLMEASNLIVAFQTILELIQIICLIKMITSLYNLSKKQPKRRGNIFVLIFEKIKNSKEENFLLSASGIIVLLASIINIGYSFFYVFNINMFQNLFNGLEQFVIFTSYLNILFCLPVLFVLSFAILIKVTFTLIAMICPNFVFSLSGSCCKKNKGLTRTIDFSDIEILEPEFI